MTNLVRFMPIFCGGRTWLSFRGVDILPAQIALMVELGVCGAVVKTTTHATRASAGP
jgi:hypothetical protein